MNNDEDWTKEMTRTEVGRAAIILGIIPDAEKANEFKLDELLKERIAQGEVHLRKTGNSQTSPAYYSARKKKK